jgi:hypothetical protein
VRTGGASRGHVPRTPAKVGGGAHVRRPVALRCRAAGRLGQSRRLSEASERLRATVEAMISAGGAGSCSAGSPSEGRTCYLSNSSHRMPRRGSAEKLLGAWDRDLDEQLSRCRGAVTACAAGCQSRPPARIVCHRDDGASWPPRPTPLPGGAAAGRYSGIRLRHQVVRLASRSPGAHIVPACQLAPHG